MRTDDVPVVAIWSSNSTLGYESKIILKVIKSTNFGIGAKLDSWIGGEERVGYLLQNVCALNVLKNLSQLFMHVS